jgi:hypothetical protein
LTSDDFDGLKKRLKLPNIPVKRLKSPLVADASEDDILADFFNGFKAAKIHFRNKAAKIHFRSLDIKMLNLHKKFSKELSLGVSPARQEEFTYTSSSSRTS